MKNWFLLLLLSATLGASAQVDTTAPFRRFPNLPPLQLTKLDNALLTKEGLKKNAPHIIMFFSPECDHCQHQVTDMLKRNADLKNYQIVLATHETHPKLAKFNSDYQLSKYTNVIVGRDTKFLLPPFYRIRNFPYLALYNASGNLVTTYEGNVSVDAILKAFSQDAKTRKARLIK